MILPDVNVLVYAHRSDDPVHGPYKEWLERLVNGAEPFGMSVLASVAFIRVVTNRRIFASPTPLPAALAIVEELTAHPRCRVVGPGEEHVGRVVSLCRDTGATGKLVADAQHAAVAMEHGCTWVSRDRDFATFEPHGLRFEHLVLG